VHRATLNDGTQVAVKIQFPGIAKSIDADIGYLKTLLSISFALPPGLFLENSLRVLSRELHEECDYLREADACIRFKTLLQGDSAFAVPTVHEHLSTRRVLTMDFMYGTPLKSLRNASQSVRDYVSELGRSTINYIDLTYSLQIGSLLVRLCLKEMFEFRFMQTDPNWSNFLWNEQTSQVSPQLWVTLTRAELSTNHL
jgi:aarF domain-containing kinase